MTLCTYSTALFPGLCVQGVGEPPSEAAAAAHSRNPTGGTVRESSHVRSTGGGRTVVDDGEAKPRNSRRVTHAAHSGEHPPLPDRLVERLKASGWEDRQEAISDLEQFVDAHPRALGPHMLKVLTHEQLLFYSLSAPDSFIFSFKFSNRYSGAILSHVQ